MASLASQPYFSAWVARMRVKYCGGAENLAGFLSLPENEVVQSGESSHVIMCVFA